MKVGEIEVRRRETPTIECSRGQGKRCRTAGSHPKRCRCRCGGRYHRKAYREPGGLLEWAAPEDEE